MSAAARADPDVTGRALAWTRWQRDSVCDHMEPWEHGSILRTPRYPTWFDASLVRVQDDPQMTVDELIGFADQALAAFGHRMVSFEVARAAMPLRPGFTAAGWRSHSLVWMHHEGPRPAPADASVREVPYDSVSRLRKAWHQEDFPGQDASDFHAHLREVQLARGDRVLAIHEHGEPVGYATLGRGQSQTEVEAVFVRADNRGQGRGTALTRAAIAAAPGGEDLWICADADDRPQRLYARLGFRPVLHTMDFLRLP